MQNYVRNLIDFDNSVLGGSENFDKIEEYLAKGENVVVLANHQTEADPGTAALLTFEAKARDAAWSSSYEIRWSIELSNGLGNRRVGSVFLIV